MWYKNDTLNSSGSTDMELSSSGDDGGDGDNDDDDEGKVSESGSLLYL